MEAFIGLLSGGIFARLAEVRSADTAFNTMFPGRVETNVVSTALMETKKLRLIQFILNPTGNDEYIEYWRQRSNILRDQTSPQLATAIQDLFRSITFSFMSSKLFQPNYTATAFPDTNVTITSYRNIYTYSRPILWVTSGISLGVSLLSVIAGVLIFLASQGAYSSKFSTTLRVSQGTTLSTKFSMEDYSGFDPLPDHIANARLTTGYDPEQNDSTTESSAAGQSLLSTQSLGSSADEGGNQNKDNRRTLTI